ncbi:E3 SUMO-protein ligase RanBP2-like isoform X3 [Gossypium australe]|uniref:E3 SUMO-protein ligase RanBP2-like isoform X3 n=1 Tax=Gossypium australe TaxID=47621 RepID=A0A5B6WED3_9ROSI|nr:E3 SUMO-protein ligase RanBP2-like isoform X3 [Gossypium australe]
MPAIAMPGASLPTYSHYFARALGALGQKMNVGFVGSGAPQQFLPLSSNWSVGGADNCGLQSAPTWPVAGNQSPGAYANPGNQPLSVPKGWRNGDWICNCGFHNYSSRSQGKDEQLYPRFDQMVGATSDPKPGAYPSYPSINPAMASNWPAPIPFPPQAATTLLGKGGGLHCISARAGLSPYHGSITTNRLTV